MSQDHQGAPDVPQPDPPAAAAAASEIVRQVPQAPLARRSDPMSIGQILADSGYFQDAKGAAQAAVKVMAGQELGFGPIASMTSVHIIETEDGTTVSVGGNLIAAKIQGSQRYRYRVVQWTNEVCELAFYERDPISGEWVEQEPHVTWTLADARQAGLASRRNWQRYPRKMLLWRAVSDGADLHCPDLFGGTDVHTPDELGLDIDAGGGPTAAIPSGSGQTTARVGLPAPAQSTAAAPPANGGGQAQGRQTQARGQAPQQTKRAISPAQKRLLWKRCEAAGIKDQEHVIRTLMLWVTGEEHSDRVPMDAFDALLEAIADAPATVDAIAEKAKQGDERAWGILERFLPARLPQEPEEPPPATQAEGQGEGDAPSQGDQGDLGV